ncbi:hypothetical protein EH220_07310 [bacterium]|nr:MAG: hypothetical protein EH220_07310 [bacterium]
MNSLDDIPPYLQSLFETAGPIIQFRILRDLLDQDESWIRTADRDRELNKHSKIVELMNARANNGTWNGLLIGSNAEEFRQSTAFSLLRLCEWGREQHPIIPQTIEKVLLPTLTRDDFIWEFAAIARSDSEKQLARRLVRDSVLYIICRSTQVPNDLIQAQLEILLTEWEAFAASESELPPALPGYAAVCWYPWDDDNFPRVRDIAVKLFEKLEEMLGRDLECPVWFEPHRLKLFHKEIYLSFPSLHLFQLELTARLGITSSLPFSAWLLEELEFRQDADGLFRFEHNELAPEPIGYYFPLEAKNEAQYPLEYSFRAHLIFKLLGYDF